MNNDETSDSREPIVVNGEDEILLYVRDRRKPSQFSIDNAIMDQWMPVIDATGFALYSLLIRMANESLGESCYPGYTMIENHLGIGRSTVSYYISLLEWCQLIYRDRPEIIIIQNGERKTRRQGNKSNTYYILDVMPVTSERLARVRQEVEASVARDTGGLTQEWGDKFLKAIDSWRPLQFHWATRRRKRIKTVVGQPSLFDSFGNGKKAGGFPPPDSEDDPPVDRSIFRIKTSQMFPDFNLIGSPATELADRDEPLVLAWIWQCQIEEMDPKRAPGFVVKRLRSMDTPGEDKVAMAYHWLTMKAGDRGALRQKATEVRAWGQKLSESLDDDFLPDLVAEAIDFFEQAYQVGGLYTDI